MKILFYEIDDFELDYFLENSISSLEAYFFKNTLNKSTYIDNKYKNPDALCIFINSYLSSEVLSQFENLKYIFLRCTGFSNIDLKYCKSKNIKVFNVPNYGTTSVSEFVFALILNVSRNVSLAKYNLQHGKIDRQELTGNEISSKTIGIIGTGAIGKNVINIANSFNMKVLAYDINKTGNYNYVELDKLLEYSDYIVLCCPLNSSTLKLINRNSFLKMKKEAFLINIARGEIVDTEALYNALISKKIKGAALDVVECEQALCSVFNECSKEDAIKSNCIKKYLFASKLLQLDNVLVTPHIAYNTFEAKKKIVATTIENIKQCLEINSGTKNLVLL